MGESGDIFFPKLDEDRDMIPFDQIALDLLKELGLTPDICETEEEAKQKAQHLQSNHSPSRPLVLSPPLSSYPIYFFGSDTSGEKSFEEFFTQTEVLDNESFINLGVVKNSKKRSIQEIDTIFDQLHTLFESKNFTKAAIVDILKEYLPNFDHIETGKGLDSKM
jgi:hypothetical protein